MISCDETHHPDDNYTFKVIKILNKPPDVFAVENNRYFVLRYVYVDNNYYVKKIYIDCLGEVTANKILYESGYSIFNLDQKYYLLEYVAVFKREIHADTMYGSYGAYGGLTDTPVFDFVALKGIK